MIRLKYIIIALLTIISVNTIQAQTSKEEAGMQEAGVTEDDIDTALKQTLSESADDASKDISKQKAVTTSGIFGSNIPSQLKKIAAVLEQNGYGDQVKELENEINSLVPDMVSELSPIMDSTINQVDFKNAYHILTGDKNAATEYLESHYCDDIQKVFEPQVQKLLTSSGVLDKWTGMLSEFNKLTGLNLKFNLPQYLAGQITDNMFDKMSDEETKIRLNSYFWTTTIMKNVMALQHKVVR